MPFDGKDYVITNARIIDGSGRKPPFTGDAVISGEKILYVREKGQEDHYNDLPVFDAAGLTLAPGFIDTHTHSDMSLFAAPEAESCITQGVTTQITGNCGLSPFPVLTEEVREHLELLYGKYGQKITWNDFSSYAEELEKRMPATNILSLCGHNTLKANICSYKGKECTKEDVQKMCELLSGTFSQGAAGLSTGLLYVPGNSSGTEELLMLMKILKKYFLPYATHLRSEGASLCEAVKEAVFLAENGSRKLHISHLKTAKEANWHKLPQVFSLLEEGRQKGLQITCDRYPWTFSATSLSVILPGLYQEMTDAAIEKKLAEDKNECRILAEKLDESIRSWDRILLADTEKEEWKKFCGKDFASIGKNLSLTPGESILKILSGDGSHAMGAFGGMSEKNLAEILRKDFTCCGSDETSRPFLSSIGRSHPRGFGSFPRFFNQLRSMNIPEEEIIFRFTGLPSCVFPLHKRGLIREGFYADMVLFDPEKFSSKANFSHPHTPAEGVKAVFVNGRLCDMEKSILKRNRNGKVLKNIPQ
ncbi:MAG: amidohydrolase family protein [Lentisphaeria bacterium]|nr:amidohydrolase family protein [Lentisphaeria bacterium]